MDYKMIKETSKCDSYSENQRTQLSAAHSVAFYQASVLKWQIGPCIQKKIGAFKDDWQRTFRPLITWAQITNAPEVF